MKTRLGRIRVTVQGDLVTVTSYRRAERGRYIGVAQHTCPKTRLKADFLSEPVQTKLGLDAPKVLGQNP